jgi:hypothetical protein
MLTSSLYASIYGREYVNYRKQRSYTRRKQFHNSTKRKSQYLIPIVVDSVDEELSLKLSGEYDKKDITSRRNLEYGKEFTISMDASSQDLINLLQDIIPGNINLKLALEDGTFLNKTDNLGNIYKNHKNKEDGILYILITKETSLYSYLLSIIKYLFGSR